ncbi:MAG: hypothetical protein P8P74_02520 [Crocinitomicaceae bacterium]|nr:hypothetical protein [Crocinitomicaceae bacterium]
MKITITLTIMTALLLSCAGESDNAVELSNSNPDTETNAQSDVPQSDDDTQVEITFSAGIMQGTHVFKPDDSNPMSQINVGYSDDVTNLNASGLISADGKHRLLINRPFMGEAEVGAQKAKKYTNDCGVFIITSLDESSSYDRIDGSYTNCSSTNVTAVGAWKESSVYNRRGVVAEYSDQAALEIRKKNGSEEAETIDVDVVFKARESRIK